MKLSLLFFLIFRLHNSLSVDVSPRIVEIKDRIKAVENQLDEDASRNLSIALQLKFAHLLESQGKLAYSAETEFAIRNSNKSNFGDMQLKRDQYEAILGQIENQIQASRPQRGRMAAPDFKKVPSFRWTEMPILYLTSGIRSPDTQAAIDKAMRVLSGQSGGCISFKKVNSKPKGPHLYFVDEPKYRNTDTCASSPLGRNYHGNKIRVSPDCKEVGTIMHETLHSLGFAHTQSRKDRDNYIIVHFDNIQEDSLDNFAIFESGQQMQGPYDFKSIMQYSSKAFAKDKSRNTMTPRINQADNIKLMGSRDELSELDVATLKQTYCSKITTEAPPCVDYAKSCGEIKEVACNLNPKSHIFQKVVRLCSSTCELCDKYIVEKLDASETCRNFDPDCFEMINNNDHRSQNLEKRARAHLLCPMGSNVCTQQSPQDQSCQDAINSCGLIAKEICSVPRGSELFTPMVLRCQKTCMLCGQFKPVGNSNNCGTYSNDCLDMYRDGDCDSKDLKKRARANLLCPRVCHVCKQPPADNPSCRDGIKTCSEIESVACKLKEGSELSNAVSNGCMRTCRMCDAGYTRSGYQCANFDNICFDKDIKRKCLSRNVEEKARYHLLCAKACGVCA